MEAAQVAMAWFDPLRDEGEAYADALQAASVPTKRHQGAGLIHGYFGMGEASEAARLEAQPARSDFKAMLERGALVHRDHDVRGLDHDGDAVLLDAEVVDGLVGDRGHHRLAASDIDADM